MIWKIFRSLILLVNQSIELWACTAYHFQFPHCLSESWGKSVFSDTLKAWWIISYSYHFFRKLDLCRDFVNKIVLGFVWYAASDESLSEIRFFPYNIMISIFVKVLPSLNKQSSLTKRDQCTLDCESQKDLATLASIQSLVYIHLWVLLRSYDDFESTIFRSIW